MAETFSVADGTQSFEYTLAAGNAATFTYTGPSHQGTKPAAPNVTDPTHDFIFGKSKSEVRPPNVRTR